MNLKNLDVVLLKTTLNSDTREVIMNSFKLILSSFSGIVSYAFVYDKNNHDKLSESILESCINVAKKYIDTHVPWFEGKDKLLSAFTKDAESIQKEALEPESFSEWS